VFKSLDEQRAYVEAEHYFPSATRELIGLPSQVINFRLLRGGTSAPV
jgi:hypothetical protein